MLSAGRILILHTVLWSSALLNAQGLLLTFVDPLLFLSWEVAPARHRVVDLLVSTSKVIMIAFYLGRG